MLLLVSSSFGAELSLSGGPSHTIWDALVQKHVRSDGYVNYSGFVKDSVTLNSYLDILSNEKPNDTWSENEVLAFWINLYNAATVQIVIRNYPVNSIKEIGPKLSIPFVNDVWEIEFIAVGGKIYSLNDIEHGILRKEHEEPLIHFALNCASHSCPPLRNEAYTPEKLDDQLREQTTMFINNRDMNTINSGSAELSKIFQWYKGDFTEEGSLIDFINRYSKIKLLPAASISYKNYSWELNGN